MTGETDKKLQNSPGRLDALQSVLDAIPNPIFLINRSSEVELVNKHAQQQRNLLHAYTHRERMGNILGCITALSNPDGCAGARNCEDCPIRTGVSAAFAGHSIVRDKDVFQLLVDGEYIPIRMWISASPLHYAGSDFVALILEDVSELIEETGVLAVCAECGKSMDEEDESATMGLYVKGHFTQTADTASTQITTPDLNGVNGPGG